MNEIPKNISDFLKSEHVLNLCVSENNEPYACSVFYAFCSEFCALVVASNENTKHMQIARNNVNIALAIAHQTKIVGLIKGIQAKGQIKNINEFSKIEQEKFKDAYFSAFPYAKILNPSLQIITLKWIKFTNNALLKKIIWQKN